MKINGLIRILFLILALTVLAAAFIGCGSGKKKEEDEGVVVERTFGAPSPSPSRTPSPTPSEEPSPSPARGISSVDGAEGLAYITTDEVNVREVNSTTGTVLGKLAVGTIISVINKDYGNGWSKISYQDNEAYMATQYLRMITVEKQIPVETSAKVNSDDVNMRADNTTDALAIGKLTKGTEVEVIKKDVGHGWSMILYQDKIAYTAARYLDFADGSGSSAQESPSPSE